MTTSLIRYRTHPDRADDNQRLIEAVFAELAATQPAGVRYLATRAPDAAFYHLVMAETEAAATVIPSLAAFKEFQRGLRERCAEPPQPTTLTIVGDYRMIGR